MGKRTNFNPSGELEGYILYSINLGAAVAVGAQASTVKTVELTVASDVYPGGDHATPPGGGTPLEPILPRPGIMFRPRFEGDLPVCKASPQLMLPAGLALGQVRYVSGDWRVNQAVNSLSGNPTPPTYTCLNPDQLIVTICNVTTAPVNLLANTLINVLLERG